MTLRANEASILYNAACIYCSLKRKPEAMEALHKAWEAGFKDSIWARRDPDLIPLHDEPEFNRLYPPTEASGTTHKSGPDLLRKNNPGEFMTTELPGKVSLITGGTSGSRR